MSDVARNPEFDENHRYTYADYLEWEDDDFLRPKRYQLFDGEAVLMETPLAVHQAVLVELSVQINNWLCGKPCKVFFAPLDVRLFPKEDKSDDTVLQPDIMVICDKNKLSKNSVDGTPDLIIEIISPTNTCREFFLKFNYYLNARVREYWVVNPESKQVEVHIYENGRYVSTTYKENDKIAVAVVPGLEIALESLWAREQ